MESPSTVKKPLFSTRDKVERGWRAEGVTAVTKGSGNAWNLLAQFFQTTLENI